MENQTNNNEIKVISPELQSIDLPPVANEAPLETAPEHSEHHHHHSAHHNHGEHHHSSHHSSHHGSHHDDHHDGRHSVHHKDGSHRSRRNSHNKKKKFELNPRVAWAVAISLIAMLGILVVVFEMTSVYKDNGDAQGALSSGVLQVELVNKEGLLVKNAVNKYLLTDLLNSYNADVTPSTFANGEGRLDAQVPVSLRVSVKEGSAISYKIELATNDSFFNAKVSYVEASSGTYSFEHLYANTTYYYRVTVYTGKGADSLTGHFKTADTPRLLNIDGLSNVRDIGNWRTDSGKRINQGLLIRGTELDGAVERDYHLTNEGLVDMLEVFGIKTDLDLRAQSVRTKSALGSRVEHRYYDMVTYDVIFTDAGKEKVRMVFSDLANPDNYPIYLHCTYGNDRTGTICYLLEAVLGVSRGDCLRDYGLSNLPISSIMAVEEGLNRYPGNSLKERAEAYLLDCGVSEYQIASIRNIFLGD